jgi:hypothetical protein
MECDLLCFLYMVTLLQCMVNEVQMIDAIRIDFIKVLGDGAQDPSRFN